MIERMKLRRFLTLFSVLIVCLSAGCTSEKASSEDSGKVKAASAVPVEADWTLHVDQTIPIEKDGMTVNYTLVLTAEKHGGTDIYGAYKGNACIKVELDASKLPSEVVKLLGGFKMEASSEKVEFEVVSHDPEVYAGYYTYERPEDIMLTPIRDYTGMALASPDMTGAGTLNLQGMGIQGEKLEVNESASGTETIPLRILVSNVSVLVEAPTLKIGRMFEGQLLGEPIN